MQTAQVGTSLMTGAGPQGLDVVRQRTVRGLSEVCEANMIAAGAATFPPHSRLA